MNAREMRELSLEELNDKHKSFKEELFNLRFQNDIGQLENTAKLSEVKKDIARLYTVSRQMNVNIG